jgi:hypothetical protein
VCLSCEQARCLAVAPIALGKLLGGVAWGDLLEPSTEGAAMHESLTVALFAAGRNVCGVQGVHWKLPGPLPMHLHTAYVEYYECLPTLLDPWLRGRVSPRFAAQKASVETHGIGLLPCNEEHCPGPTRAFKRPRRFQ